MGETLAIWGSGGHARVVAATAWALGLEVVKFLDDDESKWGSHVDGIPVSGPIAASETLGHI